MTDQGECDICGSQMVYEEEPPRVIVHCPRCGEFCYDNLSWRKIASPDEMVRLSGWVREQNAAGVIPVRITKEISARVSRMPLPGLRDRANRVLSVVAKDYWKPFTSFPTPNTAPEPFSLALQGVSYSRDQHELLLLYHLLKEEGFLAWEGMERAALTVKGLLAAEALGGGGSGSQGFVAMWFDDSMKDAWTSGFYPGIHAAGFQPVRIDNKDFVGGISDEISGDQTVPLCRG